MKKITGRLAAGICILLLLGFPLAAPAQPQLPPPNLGPLPPLPGDTTMAQPQPGDTAAPAAPEKPLPPVTITSAVDRPQVPQGERVNYIVTISWDQAAGVEEYPLDFEFPDPPSAEGLVLYANSFKAATELKSDRIKVARTYTYEFYAETKGPTEIRPVAVKYFRIGSERKSELKTQAIPVEVVKARLHLDQVARHPAALFAYLAAAVVAVVVIVLRIARARRERQARVVPERPRAEVARERLGEADRFRMSGDYVEFLRALGLEMRRFAEDALGVKVRGASGSALAAALSERLGPGWRERIDEFEKLADKVKFAGYEPGTGELDAAMATAKDLVAEVEKLCPAPGEEKKR